jgi:hypothetical protein
VGTTLEGIGRFEEFAIGIIDGSDHKESASCCSLSAPERFFLISVRAVAKSKSLSVPFFSSVIGSRNRIKNGDTSRASMAISYSADVHSSAFKEDSSEKIVGAIGFRQLAK